MESSKSTLKSAVFFDAENVSAGAVPVILSFLKKRGSDPVLNAYGDWSDSTCKQWNELRRQTPMYYHLVPRGNGSSGKQAVDKAVISDAIAFAMSQREQCEVVIVSSDSDYFALAVCLRSLGHRVMGIGEKSKVSDLWKDAYNEIHYTEDLFSAQSGGAQSHLTFFEIAQIVRKSTQWESGTLPPSLAKADDASTGHEDEEDTGYLRGIVASVSETGTYGFINTADGDEYFFPFSKAIYTPVNLGERVRFMVEKEPDPKGKTKEEQRGKAYEVEAIE